MIEYLSRFFRWSWQNKRNFALCIGAAVVFLFILFPFSDLSDRISSEVSKQTGNQVYLQMDGFNLSILTGLSLEFEKVLIQTSSLAPLKINRLEISPSILSALEQFPLGSIIAEGILRGNVEASLASGTKGSNGQKRQIVSVKADKVSLDSVTQLLRSTMPLKGQAQLNVKSLTDFSFNDQPEADLNLAVQNFEVPSTTFRSPAGPIDIPDMRIGTVQLKGKLNGGALQIESAKIGSADSDLSAQISGRVNVRFQVQGGQVIPQIGGYDLNIELNLKKSVLNEIEVFLFPLDSYKRAGNEGNSYRFKMRADNLQSVPNFGSLQ